MDDAFDRGFEDANRITFRGLAATAEVFDEVCLKAKRRKDIRLGDGRRAHRTAVGNAIFAWLGTLSAEEQMEVVAKGMRRLNELMAGREEKRADDAAGEEEAVKITVTHLPGPGLPKRPTRKSGNG